MILAAVLAVLLLLALTPVGVYAAYDGALTVRLRIGPFPLALYPPKPKKAGKRPAETSDSETPGQTRKAEPPKQAGESKKAKKLKKTKKPFQMPNGEQIRYSLRVLPPLLRRALGRTRRRIVIAPLRVLAVFGGEDPADVAELYGKAQAALGAVYPALKQLVRVRDDAVNLYTDYDSERIFFRGEVGVRILVGDVAVIGLSAAAGLLRWFVGYRRRAGRPEKQSGGQKEQQARAA